MTKSDTLSASAKSTTASVRRENKFQDKLNSYDVQYDSSFLEESCPFPVAADQKQFCVNSSGDSAGELRKIKNRESALRSRQKKQSEAEILNQKLERLQKDNNRLKLENAALSAENTVLKRQLGFFENLFA